MTKNKPEPFTMVLASTVHDMKNSLSMLGEAIQYILDQFDLDKLSKENKKFYGVIQYESSRVNNSLMQLLTLYKLENNQLPFNPSYYNLSDFLEEQKLMLSPLLNAKNIICDVEVDEEIESIFDENLLATVLENIIGNAIRYSHSRILIRGTQLENTRIEISDDGPGYPKEMLKMAGEYIQGINQSSGSTGLGLFFAQEIARMHQHNENQGFITLSNGGKLKGGRFEIQLP